MYLDSHSDAASPKCSLSFIAGASLAAATPLMTAVVEASVLLLLLLSFKAVKK
jgi:hypothetical protein